VKVATHLRTVEKCDLVVAATHMRLAEDMLVSDATKKGEGRVDLLLGGHDHHVARRRSTDIDANPEVVDPNDDFAQDAAISEHEGDVRIIKSGTDWRGLSVVRLDVRRNTDGSAEIVNVKCKHQLLPFPRPQQPPANNTGCTVTQIQSLPSLPNYNLIPPDPKTLSLLSNVRQRIETQVTQPLLHTSVPLDGRSTIVRSRETNLGNMLADAVRAFYDVDIALVNSGAIRCDRVIEPSADGVTPLCVRDVIDISPFDNAFVVKRVRGSKLLEALENSVGDSHTDGRFLQVSGLRIMVDWGCVDGERVKGVEFHAPTIKEGGEVQLITEPLDGERMYSVAMVDFIASGFDGYACFKECETLVDAEGAMTDTNLLLETFGDTAKKENEEGEKADVHTEGIERVKKAIILGRHEVDGLPVVGPVVDERITVIGGRYP